MPGDVLMALAQFAGQTVAQAAITDVWEGVRGRFARLLGRNNARKTQVAEQWLVLRNHLWPKSGRTTGNLGLVRIPTCRP